MFKEHLLLTTALLAAAALSSSAARPAEPVRSLISNISAAPARDANEEFLCNYGNVGVYAWDGGGLGGSGREWEHVAYPITGEGQTITRIKVKEEQPSRTFSPSFQAGLYGNSPSGLPGTLIASGTGVAPETCGTVTIRIPPATLKRHKRYWVVEEVGFPPYSNENQVRWMLDPHATRRYYVQTYRHHRVGSSSSSSTSPWTKQNFGVYVRVK